MKKTLIIFVLCASAGVWAQQDSPIEVTPQLVNELAEEARTNNSALWAKRSRIEAAEWNVRSIPKWRDPEVMAGGMAAERMMREEDGDIMFGVEQMLPVFGKEKAARNSAQAEVPVQEAGFEFASQNLRKDLGIALFNASLTDELLAISREDVIWVETLLTSVEQRYEAGSAMQMDVLRTQNERAKRVEQVRRDETEREIAYTTVNRLLNRNLHSGWAQHALPEVFPPLAYDEKLVQLALRFEPRLKVMRAERQAALAMVAQSRKERLPDLGIAVESRQYSGNGDPRSAAILFKMNLPWVNRDKYRAAIRRDESKVREIESLLEDEAYEVRKEIHHLVGMIDNARREALLYRDEIIPRSEQALASALAAWQSNRDAFRDLLDARRMLLEARTMYVKAVAEQYRSLVELVLCCGIADLEALDDFASSDTSTSE